MHFQDLLSLAAAEHEALQYKYDEALGEIRFLRTRLGDRILAADSPIKCDVSIEDIMSGVKNTGDDAAAAPKHLLEPLSLYRCERASASGLSLQDAEAAPPSQRVLITPLHNAIPPEAGGGAVNFQPQSKRFSRVSLANARPITGPSIANTPSAATRPSAANQNQRNKPSMTNAPQDYLKVGGGAVIMDDDEEPKQEILVSVLRHPVVEMSLVFVVLSNILVMWLETDRRAAQKPETDWFDIVDKLYLSIYILEFVLRALAYKSRVFADRWTRLDFAVIIVDIASIICDAIIGDGSTGGFNASIFRLLRSFRLLRMFKLLRFIIELQLLIHGFFGAVKAVFFAALMLEVVVLLWSFVHVEMIHPHILVMRETGIFDKCVRCHKAYSSMWNAHMTIWQQVIASDSWGLMTLEVMTEHPETSLVFLCCLMTIQFAMLNLIFTVIVDAAARAREDDEQQKLAEKEMGFQALKDKLVRMLKQLDGDNSGELALEELLDGYRTNQAFADTMASMDVTEDDMSTIFMIMDEDRSGSVSYVEFVNNMYKMKQQDVNTLLMFIKGYVVDMRVKMKEDVVQMLRQNLKSVEAGNQRIELLIKDIEALLSGSTLGSKSQASTAVSQSPTPSPQLNEMERNINWAIQSQSAEILRAIQQQNHIFRSMESPHCTPQGLCSRPSVRPSTLVPRSS